MPNTETPIYLYNTKTRTKGQQFVPIDAKNVRMYVCGPTVYDRAHLGNARPVIVFDVLNRLLRHVYGDKHVTYVRNFTDVDDKINAKAVATGRTIGEITDETIQWFLDDMGAVGAIEPDHMPRATAYIGPMIAMIEDLIAKGHAYEAEGHVLFSVSSYAEYGALSGRSVDDMIAGARVEVAPYKRDPMDFVLWKPSSADQPGWDSPWGTGRPGWHIECSAMAHDLLGASFDIHGGGNDLTFPHHENEIAQSKCAGHDFANVWMHNEMLQVEGKKMSKSLGNFFTVRDLLEQGVQGEVIRLVMLSTHYRKPMDWTETKRKGAEKTLTEWLSVLQKHGYSPKTVEMLKASGDWTADAELMGVLGNDLNTPGALARLHVMAKGRTAKALAPFAHGLETLGLVLDWNLVDLSATQGNDLPDWIAPVVDRLLEQRGAARVAKDWGEADRVRDLLNAAGVQVTDIAGAASWLPGPTFDPTVLKALK
jgi:cysteinyl-tRNA synthetase